MIYIHIYSWSPALSLTAAEMTFLRGTVKMDIPDYIVSEVDDRLSDGATPQTSQDATTAAAQTVAQYPSEYEILTESEIEEKYQADPDNAEIAIEMSEYLEIIYNYIYNSYILLQLVCLARRPLQRLQQLPRRCSRMRAMGRRVVPPPPFRWRQLKTIAKPAAPPVSIQYHELQRNGQLTGC